MTVAEPERRPVKCKGCGRQVWEVLVLTVDVPGGVWVVDCGKCGT